MVCGPLSPQCQLGRKALQHVADHLIAAAPHAWVGGPAASAARARLLEDRRAGGICGLPRPARPAEHRVMGPRVADELGLVPVDVRLRMQGGAESKREMATSAAFA